MPVRPAFHGSGIAHLPQECLREHEPTPNDRAPWARRHAAPGRLLLLSACVTEPPPAPRPPPPPAPPLPPPPSEVFAYPQRGQTPQQQDRDHYECSTWATQQTGFDPSAPGVPPHERVQVVPGPAPTGAGTADRRRHRRHHRRLGGQSVEFRSRRARRRRDRRRARHCRGRGQLAAAHRGRAGSARAGACRRSRPPTTAAPSARAWMRAATPCEVYTRGWSMTRLAPRADGRAAARKSRRAGAELADAAGTAGAPPPQAQRAAIRRSRIRRRTVPADRIRATTAATVTTSTTRRTAPRSR